MKLNRSNMNKPAERPVKIIQFGEGNFLRAFVDWMVQEMNDKAGFNGNVAVVQPIEFGMVDKLNQQGGLYTVVLKGIKDKKGVKDVNLIDSISKGINPYTDFADYLKLAENEDTRFVVSNTTEAGITFSDDDTPDMQPPVSFPAKVTLLLNHRFKTFNGATDKGFVFLPCELIELNGDKLKKYVLKYAEEWQMGTEFINWVNEANLFCNTLVDRIVPGFNPDNIAELKETKGYEDNLVVEGEQYHLWVIKAPKELEEKLPFSKAGLNVRIVDDVQPYRTRKVRLLNGPHTVMTPIAILCGEEYVRETLEHPVLGQFVRRVMKNEILPTIDLPRDEMERYMDRILDRFLNPYVQHALMSISLNSISKFRARVLPTIFDYQRKNGELPNGLVLALASLIAFYRGKYEEKTIPLNDDEANINFFRNLWRKYESEEYTALDLVGDALANSELWGQNLNKVKGLTEKTAELLQGILKDGMLNVVSGIVKPQESNFA
ncbi:tagaturonate reductase [Marinilabilia sp.]|uniref:tagaturonate reductase n=1 Tax=Marinilabilia sp. TaxID=2021252 RepID=UPI0025BDC07C|nr:tagaturonate reductase [Marinilabilia sp.]